MGKRVPRPDGNGRNMSCKMGNHESSRVWALLGVLLLAGCSGLSVRHLPSNPWEKMRRPRTSRCVTSPSSISRYRANELGIVAEAYPVIDNAARLGLVVRRDQLSVHVSDEYGRVLPSGDAVLVPARRTAKPASRLKSASIWGRTGISRLISLRYRLVLTDTQPDGTAGGGCWYRKGRSKIGRSAYPYGKGRPVLTACPFCEERRLFVPARGAS